MHVSTQKIAILYLEHLPNKHEAYKAYQPYTTIWKYILHWKLLKHCSRSVTCCGL